jgi:3-oxoacyl-[acyl-carrier-protein] synthase II
MSKRVVITGVGAVTPLGVGRQEFFPRLLAGESGLAEIKSFDTFGLPCHTGGEADQFDPQKFIPVRSLRKMDRNSSLAVAAGRLALEDAGLVATEGKRDRIGIILGVAFGSTDVSVRLANTIYTSGPRAANPILVPNVVMNAPAGYASIELGIRGINSTVNHNGTSAETALAYATAAIQTGRADAVLAGGSDVMGAFFYQVLVKYRALSGSAGGPEQARPFDRTGNGYVTAEGAGLVCLEALECARARGGRIYAEVLGWGMSSSPAPLNDWPDDPRGPVLAIRRALTQAALAPGDIDYVCACANGHPRADRLESQALMEVFGAGHNGPLVSSIKGAVGESFSSGGLRTVSAALSLRDGLVPPTLNLTEPLADLNYVAGSRKEAPLNKVLITGLSWGGTYAALVLGGFNQQE